MVIALAGKGSSGKSTLAAVVVERLRQGLVGLAGSASPALAIDADPHQSLCNLIGVQPPHTLGALRSQYERALLTGQAAALRPNETRVAFAERLLGEEALMQTAGVDVLALGRWDLPGSQCTPSRVLGYALEQLVPRYAVTLIDYEAGIEPIGRFATPIDVLLVVATPEALSLDVAGQIQSHARAVGRSVGRSRLILNRVQAGDMTDAAVVARLRVLEAGGLPLGVMLPESVRLRAASRSGVGPQSLAASDPWRRKLELALPDLLL